MQKQPPKSLFFEPYLFAIIYLKTSSEIFVLKIIYGYNVS